MPPKELNFTRSEGGEGEEKVKKERERERKDMAAVLMMLSIVTDTKDVDRIHFGGTRVSFGSNAAFIRLYCKQKRGGVGVMH